VTALIDLADLAPFGLLQIDARRRVVAANQMAQSMLRQSSRVMLRKPLSEIVFHDSPIFELIDKTLSQNGTLSAGGVVLNGPGFSAPLIVDLRLRPADATSVVIAFNQANDPDVVENGPGVAAFGRILGHEVKNPLAGISGAAQLLKRSADQNEEPLLSIILDETKRIERLISRLSAFELFSAPRFDSFNIHALLDRILSAEEVVFVDKVRFQRRYDPSLPEIMGDQDHLHEAFLNVIRNASEAALDVASSPTVTVETAFETGFAIAGLRSGQRLGRAIRVTIRDNGPGIPQERRDKLFQIFSSSKSGGRGLGLSVVSEIISAHQGRIKLTSKPGDTRFSIYLPLLRKTKE
jgi:two-component system nitrogen regulation sensor histidine kinase GlnL